LDREGAAGKVDRMTTYPIHTIESAPEGAKQSLESLQKAVGMIPNLAATMAGSPSLVNTFVAAQGQFGGEAFTGGQRQVLLLTNAVTNECSWAVAFHTAMALKQGIAAAELDAIRDRRLPADPRLAALSATTRRLIDTRGHLDETDVDAFLAAGFDHAQLFEVITGVAISTMANYAGNIADPPLEEAFQAHAWKN
jgi:AhpD family alkylhydroperoxidase